MPIQTGGYQLGQKPMMNLYSQQMQLKAQQQARREEQFQQVFEVVKKAYEEKKKKETFEKYKKELGITKEIPLFEEKVEGRPIDPFQGPIGTRAETDWGRIPSGVKMDPMKQEITIEAPETFMGEIPEDYEITGYSATGKPLVKKVKTGEPTNWEIQKEARMNVNAMITGNPMLQMELMSDPQRRIRLMNDEVKRLKLKYKDEGIREQVIPEYNSKTQKLLQSRITGEYKVVPR